MRYRVSTREQSDVINDRINTHETTQQISQVSLERMHLTVVNHSNVLQPRRQHTFIDAAADYVVRDFDLINDLEAGVYDIASRLVGLEAFGDQKIAVVSSTNVFCNPNAEVRPLKVMIHR